MQGLITRNISNQYIVKCENKLYECTARGRFKKDSIIPVVGDTVEIEVIDEEKKLASIQSIQTRKNYLKRPRISNVTQIVLVLSCKNPKPDLLLLDKQLAFAEFLKIKPVIIINKMDLVQEQINKIYEIYTKIGYQVMMTQANNKVGIEAVKKILQNQISVFSGNSGVGKSTLINSIFQNLVTKEGQISIRNQKGKNTTTSIQLYEIDENSYIADTPGFSTFDIYEIQSKNLDQYFKEFKPYIKNCEFVGCTHIKEEICGIKQAVKEEKIAQERYDRFIKIYQDLKQKEEQKW